LTVIPAWSIPGRLKLPTSTGIQPTPFVLDRNLFDIPAAEINQAKVLLTLFNGRVVYQSGDLPGMHL